MMIGVIGFVFFQAQRKTEEDQNCLPSFYRRFTKEDIWILHFPFKVIIVNERRETKNKDGKRKIP